MDSVEFDKKERRDARREGEKKRRMTMTGEAVVKGSRKKLGGKGKKRREENEEG